MIGHLIEEGTDVSPLAVYSSHSYGQGKTLLQIASRHHNLDAAQLFLERPEGPVMARQRDSQGQQALPWAAIGLFPGHRQWLEPMSDVEVTHRAIETIKALLPYNGVNERGTRGMTALALAARFCKPPMSAYDSSCFDPAVQFFLDHGADPCDAGDDYGDTPLHAALCSVDRITTVRLLLSRGARADVHNRKGDTSVHVTAKMYKYLQLRRKARNVENLEDREERQRVAMQLLLDSLGSADIMDQQIEELTTAEIPQNLEEDKKWLRRIQSRVYHIRLSSPSDLLGSGAE
ncbi:hypothetical protein PG997_002600 [Apiospora hydei]|uniref:Ankyrin n=1 Tax=Apiospora hydei TaxID=1337664 RepID=A0ABR1WWU2_9PEZI